MWNALPMLCESRLAQWANSDVAATNSARFPLFRSLNGRQREHMCDSARARTHMTPHPRSSTSFSLTDPLVDNVTLSRAAHTAGFLCPASILRRI